MSALPKLDCEVIGYRPEFKPAIAALMTEFWPDPVVNAEYFSWKYEQNPYVEKPLFRLLLVDGELIGIQGYQGARWQCGGSDETFDAPIGGDLIIDANFRQHGLSQIMKGPLYDDVAKSGSEYLFGFSAVPIPYMANLRRGWRLAGNYGTVRRETASAGHMRAIARQLPLLRTLWRHANRKGSLPGHNAFASLDALPPTELDGGILSVAKEADAPAMSALANAAAVPGLIRHVRDPAYFAWRFGNPLLDYRFVFWRDTELRGFLVLQKQRGNTPAVRIVDWEATSTDVLKRMFDTVLESGNFASLATWSAALPEETLSSLSEHGFAPIDESFGVPGYSPGLQIKTLGDNPPDGPWTVSGRCLHDFADWDLRPIYSDEF